MEDKEFTKFIDNIDLDKLNCDKIVIEKTVNYPAEEEKKTINIIITKDATMPILENSGI